MTCSYSKDFSSSGFTDVENVFIYEYLPIASGTAVKVYLYGLFLCKNPNHDQPIDMIAKSLSLSVEEVIDCFEFWEETGIVSIVSNEPFSVQYLPIRSVFSGKAHKYKTEKYTDFSKSLQSLLTGRMIYPNEYTDYYSIMETFNIKPEAMLMIIKYCIDRKGDDIGHRYISKVAKDFGARGIVTVDKVEKELSSYLTRTAEITKILTALSLKRQPDIEDLNYLKKWTQELNFETENVVFAASLIKKGSMAKLDQFLIELYSMKSFSKEEITGYMEAKKGIYELAIKINKSLSIYIEVLDTMVDTYLKKWLSFGFTGDALLYVASYCFRIGKNTLQDMDAVIDSLREQGYITLSGINDYFNELQKENEFISTLLTTAGVTRRPTPWDRENLRTWKSWNFSNEMIMESAKLSAGKSSPVQYMNAILSNWKRDGVYTLDSIKNDTASGGEISYEEYNREYGRRRELALVRAQKNLEKAMDIDGFSEIYSRLNSIEKDLAFAEINGNTEALEAFEKEKKLLLKKARSTLHKLGLTLENLSPEYSCKKCNDTGFIGTEKCDCFNNKV